MKKDEILSYLKEFKDSSQNRLFTEISLFGSYAKNQADDFSDIDVAVEVTHYERDGWVYFKSFIVYIQAQKSIIITWNNKDSKDYLLALVHLKRL